MFVIFAIIHHAFAQTTLRLGLVHTTCDIPFSTETINKAEKHTAYEDTHLMKQTQYGVQVEEQDYQQEIAELA